MEDGMGEARVMVAKGPRAARANSLPDWARDMPAWWQPRDTQFDATEQIAKEFDNGARVVFLDAPTGTGKTAMGELVRKRLEVARGLYVCTTKSLQQQVARDFPDARVLKGRANYLPTHISSRERDGYRQGARGGSTMGVTCADCDASGGEHEDEMTCSYCALVEECPYRVARREAGRAAMGVLNTAYYLAHANHMGKASPFYARELVVADECDLLEDELLGYVEVRVPKTVVAHLGLEVPKKGSHMTTIRAWLEEEVGPGLKDWQTQLARDRSLDGRRMYNRVETLREDVARVLGREDGWVRDGDEEGDRSRDALVLKPVSIEDVGDRYLWRHAERWLCMSGTIVSPETMAESLGLEEAGVEWGVVRLDMPFDKANRKVIFIPTATMTRKGQEAGAMADVLTMLDRICAKHDGDNILVHTHTYAIARQVADYLKGQGERVFTYDGSRDREHALDNFKAVAGDGGGVLVAPSMDRGIDLPGELCRVQVIVKVPMASLGSRQVSERLRTPGGSDWYLAATCRTIMQMVGRAVRGTDDWAMCYILDRHFSKVLKDGKRRGMFPQWWLDGLELGRL